MVHVVCSGCGGAASTANHASETCTTVACGDAWGRGDVAVAVGCPSAGDKECSLGVEALTVLLLLSVTVFDGVTVAESDAGAVTGLGLTTTTSSFALGCASSNKVT